ncbi:MAG: DUF1513 domain-containing protein, partial [Pseudomonadota bacterium]
MANRRAMLGGLLSSALIPAVSWADAGSPSFLSAARHADGRYYLHGLSDRGDSLFHLALPVRGHAAAAHPTRPEAVAFARRPGTFAIVLDCATGSETARLTAPEGRHFYGHGAFTAAGDLLLTTENDYEAARGVIGLWETAGYRRIGEVPSGGVGPHEIVRTDAGFAVANGGIETHPEAGRTKLNLPTMQPNLTYLGPDGHIVDQVELPPDHRLNSIRHIAYAAGRVAMGMQWQGQGGAPALVAYHERDAGTVVFAPGSDAGALKGYTGSVAISGDGTRIATTHP